MDQSKTMFALFIDQGEVFSENLLQSFIDVLNFILDLSYNHAEVLKIVK